MFTKNALQLNDEWRILMQELITVIINVYNGERYIKKCLESILNQTYTNIEILIIPTQPVVRYTVLREIIGSNTFTSVS